MARRIASTFILLALGLGGCADLDERVLGEPVGRASPGVDREPSPPAVAGWTARITTHAVRSLDPAWSLDARDTYRLASGDRVRVFVYGQPNLSRIYPVDHGGSITVPLIGSVRARGRTPGQLQQAVRARLAARYVRDPNVTVDMAQNRPFFILGEVRSAGQYPYVSGLTVKAAVAVAGGFSERADEEVAQVTSRVNGRIEKRDLPTDHVIRPGDIIYVYERFF